VRSWIIVSGLLLQAILPAIATPIESFIEAPGPLSPLKGTMLSAGANTPVVLILPGSGPTDRDGTSPLGIKASTYKLLAEGLAAQGVTSARIDKRGAFASAGAVTDGNDVKISDYAADTHAWIASIRKSTGVSCVWLLGHSEGGLVALLAAQEGTDVCGLVLISVAGRPLDEVLREQLLANPANTPLLDQANRAIDSLKAGKHVDTTELHPALLPLFRPQVQGFLINEFSYDPAALIAAIKRPILIMQGERDLQVSVMDARILAKADPKAKLILLPNVNHVLKTVNSDARNANAATYADPSLPLAEGISETVAKYIVSQSVGR
jgi:pimeloyl-ACP methyl ester carboxylesterase